MSDNQPTSEQRQVKNSIKNSRLLLLISAGIIVLSAVAVMFQFQELRQLCVCISNWLAWSWIANAAAILFSIVLMITVSVKSAENSLKPTKLQNLLFSLQSLAFTTGLVFLIIFAAKLTNVIN